MDELTEQLSTKLNIDVENFLGIYEHLSNLTSLKINQNISRADLPGHPFYKVRLELLSLMPLAEFKQNLNTHVRRLPELGPFMATLNPRPESSTIYNAVNHLYIKKLVAEKSFRIIGRGNGNQYAVCKHPTETVEGFLKRVEKVNKYIAAANTDPKKAAYLICLATYKGWMGGIANEKITKLILEVKAGFKISLKAEDILESLIALGAVKGYQFGNTKKWLFFIMPRESKKDFNKRVNESWKNIRDMQTRKILDKIAEGIIAKDERLNKIHEQRELLLKKRVAIDSKIAKNTQIATARIEAIKANVAKNATKLAANDVAMGL